MAGAPKEGPDTRPATASADTPINRRRENSFVPGSFFIIIPWFGLFQEITTKCVPQKMVPEPMHSSPSYQAPNCPGAMLFCGASNSTYSPFSFIISVAGVRGCRYLMQIGRAHV